MGSLWLTDSPAVVDFRRQLRKTWTRPSRTDTNGHIMDEESPLLGHHAQNESRTSFLRRVFFDRRQTPGMNSDNFAVRWTARTFNVTKVTLLSSPVNILLFFVPIGLFAGSMKWDPTTVFTLNFLAIIPLAAVLSFATEEISKRLGETLGGLLNATFGNAVELIVSIIALRAGEIEVVQSSMLGSILSNLLLVLGMCFLLGGFFNMYDANGNGMEQSFQSVTAQTTCSLMALSSASLVIPAALYSVLDSAHEHEKQSSILLLSRGTAIILLLLYIMYLWFQLRTHKNLFMPEDPAELEAMTEEEDANIMSPWAAGAVLIVVTILVSLCADYLVDSIDAIVEKHDISKNFIGLILIPIVGNAAEHVTACVVAVRNKMDLAMGVAIGSSIQIALLVTPFLVILGWIIDQPMSLHFETFETIAFALSVLVVTYTVQDGKSNYLEGAMLLGLYLIIALAFWAAPSDAMDKVLALIH
ncbi:calcium/proton exchanger [Coniochaeta sp. 2T2.1]|nr:calcium/proton exchanger [Coniochaeta sp. 2T2.1]